MVRRLLKSARAPAGKVKRKNGNEAAVAISESSNDEEPNAFISHVAAVSWADTQTPETMLGSHSPTKAGFLNAFQLLTNACRSSVTVLMLLRLGLDQLQHGQRLPRWRDRNIGDTGIA